MINVAALAVSLSFVLLPVRAQDPAVPTAAAAGGVYIPGGAGQIPGASLVTLGAGSDGYTAYEINGNVLAENGQQVIMTSVGAAGNVVYNCQLGTDAQATCSVVQEYDGVQYGYTEPITYFGGALAAPATATTTDLASLSTSTDPALATTTTTSSSSTDSSITGSSSSSTSPSARIAAVTSSSSTASPTSMATTSRSVVGPQANVAQSTSSNIFGAGSNSNSDTATSGASSIRSGMYSCVAIVSTVFICGLSVIVL